MKAPNREILERNLKLLFERCYEPVTPSAAYRERLRDLYQSELELRRETSDTKTSAPRPRLLPRILLPLAAAAMLVVYFQTRAVEPEQVRTASLSEILAERAIAHRTPPASSWNEWDAAQETTLPFEIVTPTNSQASIGLASDSGQIALGQNARILASSIDASGELSIELSAGELTLSRKENSETAQQSKHWVLQSPDSIIRFSHGELVASRAAESDLVLATLRSGVAEVHGRRGWVPMRLGEQVELIGGFVREAEIEQPSRTSESNRTEVAATETESEEEFLPEDPISIPSLSVFVSVGDDSTPLNDFKVSLLRLGASTEIYQPKVFTITDATDGRVNLSIENPGKYCLDVMGKGLAAFRVTPLEIDNTETVVVNVQLRTGSKITGIVLDPTGVPIEGATVLSESGALPQSLAMDLEHWQPHPTQTSVTDSEGRFELKDLRPEQHVLRATHPEFAPGWSAPITLAVDQESPAVKLRLTVGGSIRGRVESSPGVPKVGVEVLASLNDSGGAQTLMAFRMVKTNELGEFELSRLPAGYYALVNLGLPTDLSTRQQPEFQLIKVRDGEASQFNFIPNLTAARFMGRLLTELGAPIPNMGLSLFPKDSTDWNSANQIFAITTTTGEFLFPEVPPDEYQLFLTPDRGTTVITFGAVTVPNTREFTRDLTMKGRGFGGIVRDKHTGAPLGDCFVNLMRIESAFDTGVFTARQITRADGRFFFPHVSEYYYRVTAQSTVNNYGHEVLEAVLPMANAEPVVLELEAGGSLHLRAVNQDGVRLKYVQFDFLDVNGLSIGFSEDERSDALGEFKTKGVRPGTWTVTAIAAGYEPVTQVCQVVVDLTQELVFVIDQKKN